MWSGRKGEERRECVLNSTPLKSFLFFVFHLSKNQRRREKGIILNSAPSSDETVFVYRSRLYFKSQTREWEEGRSENAE